METNLRNRVRNLRFRNESRLTPLFEAISNSLHAIGARNSGRGFIRLKIERSHQNEMAAPVGQTVSAIDTIAVSDSGEGFTERNFKAFEELDTGNKHELGSKGIGRLFWLKVFERVNVESVFVEDGQTFKRVFNFGLPEGITDHRKEECPATTPRETTIKLVSVRRDYARSYRVDGEALAQAILQHFLSFFAMQFMPDIVIREGAETVATIGPGNLPPIEDDPFKINEVAFRLIHMKLVPESSRTHGVYFCASDRVVKSKSLLELLGNFTRKPLEEDGRLYCYAGYVLSEELTQNVAAERDEFQIEQRPEDLFGFHKVSMEEIEEEVASRVKLFLAAPLEALCEARDARVEKVFSQKVPELSYLQRLEIRELQNVSFDAKENDIALTANRVHFERRRSAVERLDHTLEHLEARDLGDFETFRSTFAEQIKTLSEVSQADLSAYMLYRQRVLAIMLKMVQFSDDGSGFEKEKAIHSLLFPRFRDSEGEQIYDGHNLWLLDEALAYEGYIASDVKLSHHKLLISDSDKQPDIVAYGIQFAVSVPARPFDHITIIELKRPGRKMEKNFNPIQQIYNYIDDIRGGKIRDFNGLEIKTNQQTRFTGIVLCDTMNETVRTAARREKLILESDGLSYHGSNPDYNLYIRVVSFRQVYEQAQLRLKNFFDRLGLRKS